MGYETVVAFSVIIPLFVCSCCIIYCCWIGTGKCQRGVKVLVQPPPTLLQSPPTLVQSPPTPNQQSQPAISSLGQQLQTQPSHTPHLIVNTLPPPQYTTPDQYDAPQYNTPDQCDAQYTRPDQYDAPPPYSDFQDEAIGVLGQNT